MHAGWRRRSRAALPPAADADDAIDVPVTVPVPVDDGVDVPVPDDPHEILVLQLKPTFKSKKGRELDPKLFSDDERAAFRQADIKQWQKHLNLDAVEIIQPDEAARIMKSKPQCVLPVPARFVRTNLSEEPGELEARSRLVLPGHFLRKGIEQGEARTDSPTFGLVAMNILLAIAAHFQWDLGSFDVESAFLTGRLMEREVYFRPPPEGLPGLPPGCLIRAKKGLFGVPEAPRLWYLEILEKAKKVRFEQVPGAPCLMVLRDLDGITVGLLCLHVDDVLMAGGGDYYRKQKAELLRSLRLKHNKDNVFTFLKRDIKRDELGDIWVTFGDAVMKIKPVFVPKARRVKPDDPLQPSELRALRSIIGELSWPVHETFPEFCYDVSDLQQRVPEATASTLLRANSVLKNLQERAGKLAMCFPRGDKSGRVMIGLFTDASFDKQPRGGSQQGFIILMGDRSMAFEETPRRSMRQWSSTKIHRVVRSTLAAEACALATGYDAAVYVRALIAFVMGKSEDTWVRSISHVPMMTWTDCKSRYEMLHKEGSIPTEKRVALDIYDVRQYLDQDDLLWTSTSTMIADPLTKHFSMKEPTALADFLRTTRITPSM